MKSREDTLYCSTSPEDMKSREDTLYCSTSPEYPHFPGIEKWWMFASKFRQSMRENKRKWNEINSNDFWILWKHSQAKLTGHSLILITPSWPCVNSFFMLHTCNVSYFFFLLLIYFPYFEYSMFQRISIRIFFFQF